MNRYRQCFAACLLVPTLVGRDVAVAAGGLRPLSEPALSDPSRFETQALSLIPVFCSPGYWEGSPIFPAALVKVNHREGRDLSYRDYGDLKGPEVFHVVYLSGNGGTSLEPMGFSIQDQDLPGIRVTAVDVPGIGDSTAKPDHTLEGWAADLLEFANSHFGPDSKFFLYGFSAGARYAEACAAYPPLKPRILGMIVDSGLGPVDQPGELRQYNPRMRMLYTLARRYYEHPTHRSLIRALAQMLWVNPVMDNERLPVAYQRYVVRGQSSEDQAILAEPAIRESVMRNLQENLKQGAEAWIKYMAALTIPSFFQLSDIQLPVIMVLHGTDDQTIPFSIGERVARELGVAVIRLEGQGHRSVFKRFVPNVREMVGRWVALNNGDQFREAA